MGGFGSGDWYRLDTKKTVEQSKTLAMKTFRDRIFPLASGTITWGWADGRTASVGYRVDWNDEPVITLHYRWRDSEEVEIPIRLQTTKTNFNGERTWFTCPLIVRGVPCNRRVGKLHLPPSSRYFGCRQCHGLTYRSSQEAHQEERMFGRIERMQKWMASLERRET